MPADEAQQENPQNDYRHPRLPSPSEDGEGDQSQRRQQGYQVAHQTWCGVLKADQDLMLSSREVHREQGQLSRGIDRRLHAVHVRIPAGEVEGVKSVTDYFLPKKKDDTCGTTANLKLSTKLNAKLIGDGDISSTQIEVKAIQCHIILLGLVGSADEISKAISHAKAVEGVRSVKSFLRKRK